MKTIPLCLASLALAFAATANAAHLDSSLSGTYEVLKSDCAPFLLFVGEQGIQVQADANELSIRAADNNPQYVIYDFAVGSERVNCLSDCYSVYEGSYAAGGEQFNVQRFYAGTLGAPASVLAGTTRFSISGDILEISSTDNGQDGPGPLLTCQLKKNHY